MGVDIHLFVVGRKDSELGEILSTYRAIEVFGKNNKGEFKKIEFPYFRNTSFFNELKNRFENGRWRVKKENIENFETLSEYFSDENCFYGHSWMTLKELRKWIGDLEHLIENDSCKDASCSCHEINENNLSLARRIYNHSINFLNIDEMSNDERDLIYDEDNTVVLFMFDN